MNDEWYTASAATTSLHLPNLARTAWPQSSFLSLAHWIKVAWIGKVQTWRTCSLFLFCKSTGFRERERKQHVSPLNATHVDYLSFLGQGRESVLFRKSANILRQSWWTYTGHCDSCSLISSSWISLSCFSMLVRVIVFKPLLPTTFIWTPPFPRNTQMSRSGSSLN